MTLKNKQIFTISTLTQEEVISALESALAAKQG
ncbi:hypothetical protein KT99_13757 [Shewanella benthica KT99]|uniref:Uncharacterized protein n=1 Tax=Shewanella benthica KT99 TaxID=314608 RepID=A9DEC5_9GAMM|nr:hypothetical protein KT99_13757 [Shewanella benthica KT99]